MIHFDRVSLFAKAIGAKVGYRVLRKLYKDVKAENDALKTSLAKCVILLDLLREAEGVGHLLTPGIKDLYKEVVEEARSLAEK